ncbi:unnamed protein product [Arabidopsis lyrata]|nr:unnamed protein product [Arabidopsis lyrata]
MMGFRVLVVGFLEMALSQTRVLVGFIRNSRATFCMVPIFFSFLSRLEAVLI